MRSEAPVPDSEPSKSHPCCHQHGDQDNGGVNFSKKKNSQVYLTRDSCLPLYEGDVIPDRITEHDKKALEKDYKAMPEEFYTRTNRRAVRPEQFPQWFNDQKSRKNKVRWNCWELCSGSGRFSLVCALAGLMVGFPIDFR